MEETAKIGPVVIAKELRVELDATLQKLKYFHDCLMRREPITDLGQNGAVRQTRLSIEATESAIMRLGMTLKELGTENPYPNSYKPENTIVDPTADGLKM
jgi:hypothetical protein